MSFAVRLDSASQALHRRLRMALAAFALAASSFALAFAEPAQRGWIALASLACFAFAFGRARLAARRHPGSRRGSRAWLGAASPATGRLSIDDTGSASWTDGIEAAGGSARPVRIERWNLLGPFAWLRLRADGGREAIDVLLARRGAAAAQEEAAADWRRLRAWLLWYGRGGTPAGMRVDAARGRE